MFSKKLSCDNFTNLIAPSSHISGTVFFDGVMKIQGTVEGDVIKPAESNSKEYTIIVDEMGLIQSNEVFCNSAIIKGTVTSKILRVEDTLRVHSRAKITSAKIYYRTLEIEPGALLTDCKMIHLDHIADDDQV